MNFEPGHIDPQLRDWLIAFAICMTAMFWKRLFGLKEPVAEADGTNVAAEDRR